ncbi:MAG TPA: hypothetical protein VFV87_03645 [Pirellulaceae bacterium]|nr:hypothetical protein [Pirellulaceae bacterium]
MKRIVGWFRKAENLNAILHSLVGSIVFAVVLSLGAMGWSYVQGLSPPWIAITGVAALGSVLWGLRQVLAMFPEPPAKPDDGIEQSREGREDEPLVSPEAAGGALFGNHASTLREEMLQNQIAKLNSQLQSARKRALDAEKAVEAAQGRHAKEQSIADQRRERLLETKAAIREQINAAPPDFEYDSVKAWEESTNDLLRRMGLSRQLPQRVLNLKYDAGPNRQRFQQNIAYLRGLIVTLTERDIPKH